MKLIASLIFLLLFLTACEHDEATPKPLTAKAQEWGTLKFINQAADSVDVTVDGCFWQRVPPQRTSYHEKLSIGLHRIVATAGTIRLDKWISVDEPCEEEAVIF